MAKMILLSICTMHSLITSRRPKTA